MAYQKGDIKLEGRLGDLTFYRRGGSYQVRRKAGVSAERFASDPKFVRSRENSQEFGRASAVAKLIRRAVQPVLSLFHDGSMQTRLNKRILQLVKGDAINLRGERDLLTENLYLLQGFSFNREAAWKDVYYAPVDIDFDQGAGKLRVYFPSHWSAAVLNFPKGPKPSGVRFTVATVSLDMENEHSYGLHEHSPILPTSGQLPQQLFELEVEKAHLPLIVLVGLAFFREKGGFQIPIEEPLHNALDVITVFEAPE